MRDLDLRRQTGTRVISVVRGEQSHPNPSSDLRLEPGDCPNRYSLAMLPPSA